MKRDTLLFGVVCWVNLCIYLSNRFSWVPNFDSYPARLLSIKTDILVKFSGPWFFRATLTGSSISVEIPYIGNKNQLGSSGLAQWSMEDMPIDLLGLSWNGDTVSKDGLFMFVSWKIRWFVSWKIMENPIKLLKINGWHLPKKWFINYKSGIYVQALLAGCEWNT
jgi:hypothetical protein